MFINEINFLNWNEKIFCPILTKTGMAMRNNLKSIKNCKTDSFSSLKLLKDTLTRNAMQKIRGGDGEGNNGGDIIIIPKPK